MAQAFKYPAPDLNLDTVINASSILSKIEDYKNVSHEDHENYQDFLAGTLSPYIFANVEIRGELNLAIPELDGVLPQVGFLNCQFTDAFFAEKVTVESISFEICTFQSLFSVAGSTIKDAKWQGCWFNDMAIFSDATFKNRIVFFSCHFSDAWFSRSVFNKQIFFSICSVSDLLDLQHIIIESNALSLGKVPIDKIRIAHAEIQKLNYEEVTWPDWGKPDLKSVLSEETCRAWKVKTRSTGDEALASNWHMLEKQYMLKRVKKEKNWFMLFLLYCYRQLSMYGESPTRAAAWLVFFLVLPFFSAWWNDGVESLKYALGGIPFYASLAPNLDKLSLNTQAFLRTCQGVITLQLSLLFFAIRNKLRR